MRASRRPRVVVIGGGFAGLAAVRALKGAKVDVMLIDRRNHHSFQPLLYQVATGGLDATAIAAPLRHIVRRQKNVTTILGEVGAVSVDWKRIEIDGVPSWFDYLIVATGSAHAYFGHDEWARHALALKTIEDALRIRERILLGFEHAEATPDPRERAMWLTFVIIGAGATGVELAGALAEIARHTLRGEFRRSDPATARIVLAEAGPRVLQAFPEPLGRKARTELERLGVEVLVGRRVTAVDERGVSLGDERIETRAVLWAAGVEGSPLGGRLVAGEGLGRDGRVRVTPYLTVPGSPDVFVVGDLARVPEESGEVPLIAPAAKQMGRYAARAIRSRIAGRRASPFRYRDYGALATIGRKSAVVRIGRLKLSGLLAWWVWLIAHIYFLVGFRNRLVVLVDWAVAYWTYGRGARIVARADRERWSDAAPARQRAGRDG